MKTPTKYRPLPSLQTFSHLKSMIRRLFSFLKLLLLRFYVSFRVYTRGREPGYIVTQPMANLNEFFGDDKLLVGKIELKRFFHGRKWLSKYSLYSLYMLMIGMKVPLPRASEEIWRKRFTKLVTECTHNGKLWIQNQINRLWGLLISRAKWRCGSYVEVVFLFTLAMC